MVDEKNAPHPDVATPPRAGDAPSNTDAEANRQMGAGETPHVQPEAGGSGQVSQGAGAGAPNVGAAHAPVSADDVEDRPDKTLYDRLADKDVSPVEQNDEP